MRDFRPMSALPPIADIRQRDSGVRFGSKADIDDQSGDVRFTPKSGHSVQEQEQPRLRPQASVTRVPLSVN
jgi:hypothetical protein